MKFLIYIASQTHIETTTKFCELDYFEKNEKNQNLPLSDLFFIFFVKFDFLCDVSLTFWSCYIQSLTHSQNHWY